MIVPFNRLGLLALVSLATAQTLPSINLAWGSYPATTYESDSNILLFRNVRFGAKPARFNKPSFPSKATQDPTGEISCYQIPPGSLKPPKSPKGRPQGDSPSGPPDLLLPGDGLNQTEDCLFLDVYAPADNFDAKGNPTGSLPVIVWIYGGAYLVGSKRSNDALPLYTGQSILQATGYKAIFVTGNYRLGAFGWLAGNFMESQVKSGTAIPNAGLYDQALLLSWVKSYIGAAGGDAKRISAWGESAGASSILHHLIRQNGGSGYDPGFHTFLTQSPAYMWQWDNTPRGKMDQTFLQFQHNANCSSSTFDMNCLLQASEETINQANIKLASDTYRNTSQFPVGPSVDGQWITTIPSLLLANGGQFKGITAAIISHVGNEAESFTPNITDSTGYSSFLSAFFPGTALSAVRTSIAAQTSYQAKHYPLSEYPWRAALRAVIRDSSFVCNARALYDAFTGMANVYMVAYNFPIPELALHASDLIPLFMNNASEAYSMLSSVLGTSISTKDISAYANDLAKNVAPTYKAYLGGFAMSGTPTATITAAPAWPTATVSKNNLGDVMMVNGVPGESHFKLRDDGVVASDVCSFWRAVASQVMRTVPTGTAAAAPAVVTGASAGDRELEL